MGTVNGKSRGVRVRTAKIDDAGSIANLSGQLGYPSSTASVRQRLRNILAEPGHTVWVAEKRSRRHRRMDPRVRKTVTGKRPRN